MINPEVSDRRTTPGSRALHERAVQVMPSGTTRTTTYFDPYPLYVNHAADAVVAEQLPGWRAALPD